MNKEYLICEKPWKALLVFAFPMIIGNLFQQLYTMVDTIVVGKYVSENALAAVGACYSLTAVFISIAIGGGIGASVITSRYFGARDYRRMKTSIKTALFVFCILSVTLAVFGWIFSKQMMVWLNTPVAVLDDAILYLKIYFLGLPFLFMYNILSSMFNALGKSKIPLYLLIFSSVFNMVLDVVLVRDYHMGVKGVAVATFIAQGISAVVSAFLLVKEMKNYPASASAGWFDRMEFTTMSKVALPSILQQSTISIGMMLVQSVVNSFGEQVLAGFSAGTRIESLCIVPMMAMGNVMSAYTAQNIGAGRLDRVYKGYKVAYILVGIFALVDAIVVEGFYPQLLQMFLEESQTGIAYNTGVTYTVFIGWFYIFIGLKMITDGLLRGAGYMKWFTIANMVNLGIRVFLSMIFAPIYGVEMVWYAIPIGWLANYLISFVTYLRGTWKRRLVG
ncbi:MAG: MATE family efflux transporter [Lachnospiraceae bacterium]|nr:MATE family efflux transporter [Lachnospiraceae bacterium]